MAYTVDGYRLGTWVDWQRANFARGTLESDRQQRLEDLPGWRWDLQAAKWEEGFRRLLDYVERHSHARVPVSYTVDGYKLGQWVRNQRNFHAKGTLDPDREARLEDVPSWTWDPRADSWKEGFRRLLHYVEHTGHALVPNAYTDDGYRLGQWVDRQRRNHAKGTLDVDRQRRLEELPGWTWKASSST